MSEQQNLFRPPQVLAGFDVVESEHHKEVGQQIAAENNARLLTEAREIAKNLGKQQPEVNADDVMAVMVSRGYGVHCLGNAAGSLFSGREWQWTGRRVKSKRIHAHANEIKTWRLV